MQQRRTPCLRCHRTFTGHGSYCPSCRQYPGRPTRARRLDGAKPYGAEYERNRALILRGDPPCHWCRHRSATTADHVVPYSRGGDDSPSNLRPACWPCNHARSRGATLSGEHGTHPAR